MKNYQKAFIAVAIISAMAMNISGCSDGDEKDNTNITYGNTTKETTLEVTEEKIPEVITIQGEEYNTGLVKLSLRDKYLENEDIEPLKYMVNLKELSITGTRISDISVLSGLTDLEELILPNNQIVNIANLKDLENLQTLGLRDNQISDISVLSELTELRTLRLSDNQISDISVLSGLTNLQTLSLDNNQISDMNVLFDGLDSLEEIFIYSNPIDDWLDEFCVEGNSISVWFLRELTYLYICDIIFLSNV